MKPEAEVFFDRIAGRYDRSFARSGEASLRSVHRMLECITNCPRVLDLGVGTGREVSALQDRGHVVTGFDISSAMLEKCARRSRPITLVKGDLWDPLPFEDASFDAVIAMHGTLAHPPDGEKVHERFSAELGRVLRAGGVFVAELPSPAWLEKAATADPSCEVAGQRFVFRDSVSGLAIRGEIVSGSEWTERLRLFETTLFDFGDEMMIVGRRSG